MKDRGNRPYRSGVCTCPDGQCNGLEDTRTIQTLSLRPYTCHAYLNYSLLTLLLLRITIASRILFSISADIVCNKSYKHKRNKFLNYLICPTQTNPTTVIPVPTSQFPAELRSSTAFISWMSSLETSWGWTACKKTQCNPCFVIGYLNAFEIYLQFYFLQQKAYCGYIRDL